MGAFIGVAMGLASMAHADPGDDATRSAARKVAMAGIAALQQGDVAQATEKLEKAYRVLQVPSVALWSARALAKRGRLVEASERYGEASRLDVQGDKAVQLQARKDAATELEALTRRIPTLLILVEGANGADVKLKVDGAAVPSALIGEERPANPGQHRVSGDLGPQHLEETAELVEGSKRAVTLRFAAQALVPAVAKVPVGTPPPIEPAFDASTQGQAQRTWSYVALGLGGASLVVGGVTGVMVLQKKGSLECPNGPCQPGDQVDSFRSLRTVSTVGFIAGGALAATGLVLLLTSSPSKTPESGKTSLHLAVSPMSAFVSGEF